ncbi:MAG: right-handed parallel beta-helix repeat-containing protein, partial [Candidatus Bathyarchaeota archaeon]|nr:right-handed parallel beta-helix repeat-containing protein [Candidatus Bathyarchaeota archaeon]
EKVNAEQNTVVVPDDYVSIQEAIDNSLVGGTVYVRSGLYHENLVINKSLSLIGENVDTTIIDGNPAEGYRIPIKIQSDNVSVSGFKVLYGYSGISVGDSNYCNISGNRIAANEHGIMLVGCSHCVVSKNYFELVGLSSAIQLSFSNSSLLTGNYITNCTEGIQVWQGSTNNTVTENTITFCDDVAIRLQYADNNTVTRNDVSHSGIGTSVYVANNNTITQNNYFNNIQQLPMSEWYAKTFGYNGSINFINNNYWSNYNGTDSNGDGYGDTPYLIDEKNQDNNPIMSPITIEIIPEFPSSICVMFLVVTIFVIAFKRRLFTYREDH